ncbi:MAG: periplasmic heavy metal sensor [Ignavibacteriales bacterium]|nr:MAG: periplasmic heavy metal sensor [Ignavibacteriales bacterium]
MKKLLFSIFSLILLTNFSLFSQPTQDEPPMGPREGGIKKLLKLSAEQEKQFDDLVYQHKQDAVDIHAKIQKNRLELERMVKDNKIDEKNLFQLTDENSKLQGNLKSSAVRNWFEIYKLLNDDQKALWSKHILQMTNPQAIRERIKGKVKNFMMNRRPRQMNRNF